MMIKELFKIDEKVKVINFYQSEVNERLINLALPHYEWAFYFMIYVHQ